MKALMVALAALGGLMLTFSIVCLYVAIWTVDNALTNRWGGTGILSFFVGVAATFTALVIWTETEH